MIGRLADLPNGRLARWLIYQMADWQVGSSGGGGWEETLHTEGDHEGLLQRQERKEDIFQRVASVQNSAKDNDYQG